MVTWDMFIVHWPRPLESRIHFPTSSKHLKVQNNSSLYRLQTWWALLLSVCANRRRAPLSGVCDESFSAWLWPEAVIGCVINANETLQHWNQKQQVWLSKTPCGNSALIWLPLPHFNWGRLLFPVLYMRLCECSLPILYRWSHHNNLT